MRPLKLSDARGVLVQRYPCLDVTIEGREHRFVAGEWKATLRQNHLVYLGEGYADLGLPARRVPQYGGGGTVEVEHCTADRRLVDLLERFHLACDRGTFREGPVPLPD